MSMYATAFSLRTKGTFSGAVALEKVACRVVGWHVTAHLSAVSVGLLHCCTDRRGSSVVDLTSLHVNGEFHSLEFFVSRSSPSFPLCFTLVSLELFFLLPPQLCVVVEGITSFRPDESASSECVEIQIK